MKDYRVEDYICKGGVGTNFWKEMSNAQKLFYHLLNKAWNLTMDKTKIFTFQLGVSLPGNFISPFTSPFSSSLPAPPLLSVLVPLFSQTRLKVDKVNSNVGNYPQHLKIVPTLDWEFPLLETLPK